MSSGSLARVLASIVIAGFLFPPGARGELATWDQARVAALARELKAATDALDRAATRQPAPAASTQSRSHYRLEQIARLLPIEAGHLVDSLEKGEGREPTLPIYHELMQLARSARDAAADVALAQEVGERAGAVRRVLNELGPYYDPDFPPLAPHPGIEPEATGGRPVWDQAQVARIAQELATATHALQETFVEQSPSTARSMPTYYDLQHLVWALDTQADLLVSSLERGDGRDQTMWIYGVLVSYARSARYKAHDAFVTEDVGRRAGAVRGVLNQLGPYYDPDFRTWVADPEIEPASTP